MLSAYILLKPPQFGDCIVWNSTRSEEPKLTFEKFKTIFSNNGDNHLEKLRDKINTFLEEADVDEEEAVLHTSYVEDVYPTKNTVDCIIEGVPKMAY
jgi:hypothetical protein